jgi:hypothetical protein
MVAKIVDNSRKILIKFGSSTLADVDGRIDDTILFLFAAHAHEVRVIRKLHTGTRLGYTGVFASVLHSLNRALHGFVIETGPLWGQPPTRHILLRVVGASRDPLCGFASVMSPQNHVPHGFVAVYGGVTRTGALYSASAQKVSIQNQ